MPLKLRNRQRQKMFDSVTERIRNQTQGGLKVNPETGVRYEEPLEEKHPGLTVGLMAAQPGTILEKVLAPSVYKGMINSINEGNLSEALMASVAPVKGVSLTRVPESAWAEMLNEEAIAEAGALRSGTLGSSKFRPMPSKPITEAEKLGIPKALRSNPKALEDPYYWGYQQWNQRYNAAVNSENFEEAQRLRDLHFLSKAPDTKISSPQFHGTGVETYNIMDSTKNPGRTIGAGEKLSNFFTDYDAASAYKVDAQGMGTWYNGEGRLIKAYLNIKNPYIFDYEGARFSGIGGMAQKFNYLAKKFIPAKNESNTTVLKYFPTEGSFIKQWRNRNPYLGKIKIGKDYLYSESKVKPEIKEMVDNIIDRTKHDGAIIKNITELDTPITDYVTFSSNQVKLSDVITYDSNGKIIPLVKRDNFHNPDIRYKQGGKLKRK